MMIIGLTGKNGAGKTEVVNYLKSKGFETISLSDILRDEVKKRGLNEKRENLMKIGNEMRKNFGSGILAIIALNKIKSEKNYCIDSIRNVGEIEELKKNKNFLLIGIKAPVDIRYKRALKRGRIGENISFEKFKELEEKEKLQLNKCVEMADKIIDNSGTIYELKKKINEILSFYLK